MSIQQQIQLFQMQYDACGDSFDLNGADSLIFSVPECWDDYSCSELRRKAAEASRDCYQFFFLGQAVDHGLKR